MPSVECRFCGALPETDDEAPTKQEQAMRSAMAASLRGLADEVLKLDDARRLGYLPDKPVMWGQIEGRIQDTIAELTGSTE